MERKLRFEEYNLQEGKMKPFQDKKYLIETIQKNGYKIIMDSDTALYFQSLTAVGKYKIKSYGEFNCHDKDYSFNFDLKDNDGDISFKYEKYDIKSEDDLIDKFLAQIALVGEIFKFLK